MSAAVASRNSPHGIQSPTTSSTMETKRLKTEDKSRKESPLKESRTTAVASSTKSSASPKTEPVSAVESKQVKQESKASDAAEPAQPLAPPPRPNQAENEGNGPDYFAKSHKNHLSSEPNPFEQSFGQPGSETPGKAGALPPISSITSPAPLGPATNASLTGGFSWGGGSLRTGPLSPAMLSGPTGDYFDTIRSFPTPNESSLRTGLTPGGGGSMFPAPSPGTQALFNSFTGGGATPGVLDFQRAAVNARAPTTAITSAPGVTAQTAAMPPNMAQHPDNEAANGLFMLAQASAPQTNGQYGNGTTQHVRNGNGSISATSHGAQEDLSDDNKATRKSKRTSAGKNNRRKTDEIPAKQPAAKRGKSNAGMAMEKSPEMMDDEMDSDMDMDADGTMPKDTKKMTDEEKRKNFLERNRVAALKCRQRKKQWLQNLQSKVELYSSENDALNAQVSSLRDEVLNLKTILIAHKDCPIAQQQSQTGAYLQQNVDYGNAQYGGGPYGMAGMHQHQQAVSMSGRRPS